MKIDRKESKKKVFGKNLNFNKKLPIKTVIGVFVVSTTLILGQTLINNSDISENVVDSNNFNIHNDIYAIEKYKQQEQKDYSIPEENFYLDVYSDVYKLNPDKVYEIAANLTNNFTSEEYLNSLNPGYSVDGITCDSKEKGTLIFTRHLYQKPQDFNTDLDSIINPDYKEIPMDIPEEIIVKHYSDLFNVDPVLVLAIEYHESARYSSDAYLYHNNPAGLMSYYDTNVIRDFPTIDAGIIEHVYQLKKYYIDEGLTTPEAIREKYSPSNADNDPYDLNKYWINSVRSFMEEINNNPEIFEQNNPFEENNLTI